MRHVCLSLAACALRPSLPINGLIFTVGGLASPSRATLVLFAHFQSSSLMTLDAHRIHPSMLLSSLNAFHLYTQSPIFLNQGILCGHRRLPTTHPHFGGTHSPAEAKLPTCEALKCSTVFQWAFMKGFTVLWCREVICPISLLVVLRCSVQYLENLF